MNILHPIPDNDDLRGAQWQLCVLVQTMLNAVVSDELLKKTCLQSCELLTVIHFSGVYSLKSVTFYSAPQCCLLYQL